MSIPPRSCKVLVIGGGPGGSYTAAALAREGIDVVVLEAEKFPRYHVGESMLPSIRYFLQFIDAYDKFNAHGFIHKNGAAFRLNQSKPEAFTDFIASGGPNGYAWNVVRSESDELLFKHAGASGAKIFDETKIESIEFEPVTTDTSSVTPNPGRPVSATYTRKADGSTGVITFDYLVDASGRNGVVSTKYLKNRKFNEGLKNIANWGYWKGGGIWGEGYKAGSPYFEALQDASGWCWFIPLHNGTHSVGVVQNQKVATAKKRELGGPSPQEFYTASLEQAPRIKQLLSNAELISDIKSASDWSYTASTYAFPNVRLVGDAGCFIDPFFSSGCHLAYLGGLSAAVTISASIRGDIDEAAAASWHNKRIIESYTRFFLVVSSALKQIKCAELPVINDFDEDGFDRAFKLFQPVIQGTVDADSKGKLSQEDISKTVQFCVKSFMQVTPEQQQQLTEKLKTLGLDSEGRAVDGTTSKTIEELQKDLTVEEKQFLDTLRSRRLFREDAYTLDSFTLDAIDGLAPNLERGKLTLVDAKRAELDTERLFNMNYLGGKSVGMRAPVVGGDTNGNAMKGHAATVTVSMNGHLNGVANGAETSETLTALKEALAPIIAKGTSLDVATRHAMMAALQEASESLETPADMVLRFCESGRQVALIKVANQMGVFKALAASATPMSIEELAKPTGADERLVSRILRYLAAIRLVTETGKNSYKANKQTHNMADPRIEGGLSFFHAVHNRAIQVLPESLEENKLQNPTSGVWPKAAQTDLELWPWLKKRPEILEGFQRLMTLPRYGDWLNVNPFAHIGSLSERMVFVDVGGSVGHQCARVRQAHPELSGRIVCQDLPETIKQAHKIEGVNLMPHDFFTPQPVKGAIYYYLRSICHDWSDEKSIEILRNIIPAMAPDSQILLDEMVLPNTGAPLWSAGQDLQMMSMFGSMERTVDQWYDLVDRAGLKIVDIKTYAPVISTSIIYVQLK